MFYEFCNGITHYSLFTIHYSLFIIHYLFGLCVIKKRLDFGVSKRFCNKTDGDLMGFCSPLIPVFGL